MLFCRAGPVCPAVGAGKESPSHGFAVPAPFRQGGRRDGGRIATASVRTGLAMTGRFTWGAVQGRAGRPGGRPLRTVYR